MKRHRSTFLFPSLALGVGLVAGCYSFRRDVPLETIPAADSATRDRYQVWSHGSSQVLWSLRRAPDTLSGVPYWKDPACDSCRVRIPIGEVDSVRVTAFDGNRTLGFAILMTPVILIAIFVTALSDPNY